jgi:quinol monooxygenase YgiN
MIRRVVKMHFRLSEVENFSALFHAKAKDIRAMPGCIHLELWQDVSNPEIFFTYSLWEEIDFLESYRASPLFKDVWSQTKLLFKEKPVAWSVNQLEVHA